MIDAAYEKLIPALNLRSTSLPSVKCDEFFAMVSFLFTPGEAAIAAAMPLGFASVEEFGACMPGSDNKKLAVQLETMANKGLIHSKQANGHTVYELLPFFPGSMELQFYRTDADDYLKQLDILMGNYGKALRNMFSSGNTPIIEKSSPGRKVPVDTEIYTQSTIIPYQEMKELIENTEVIAAGVCHCRHAGAWRGKPCSRPQDNCMILGSSAEFTIERGLTKRLTKEQALQMLDDAEKAALVHQYCNTPDHFSNILCNCCSCHCFALTNWNRTPAPSQRVVARYLVKIDEEACIACEACIERCQTQALKMEDGKLVRDEKRCIGCGLCMYACPVDALILEKRAAGLVPLRKCQ
jgi:Na+-translocating ferredoxin:NAD+ oxidoreductase subunit B